MKYLLAAFAAIGLVAATPSAKAQAAPSEMDMSWGIRTTPEIQPELPQAAPCAQTFKPQSCVYYLLRLKEHRYKSPNPTDFIAALCQATPQPLVDWQTDKPRPVAEPSSACADERRPK